MGRALTPGLLALLLLSAASGVSHAQRLGGDRTPYLAYVYPAGGRPGSTFQVMVGGQYLLGPDQVCLSGPGVQGSVVERIPSFRALKPETVREFTQQVRESLVALSRPGAVVPPAAANRAAAAPKPASLVPPAQTLPDLSKLTLPTLQDLQVLLRTFFSPRSRGQTRPQLAEMVVLEIRIAADAPPGDRDLRLITALGLTNPVCFQVGTAPEIREQEPNSRQDPASAPVSLPATFNGRLTPGDVDCFRFPARAGQRLVLRVQARHLIPYLADAVPGWLQATLALYDPQGREVAFADDYRFDPDPVLLYQVPQDGVYMAEVRDALWRGREDFIYRITAGEQPFVTSFFPLGGREGAPVSVTLSGWNLPVSQASLDTAPGAPALRQTQWAWPGGLSNAVPYAVDTLPESLETEPNNTPATAQRVALPRTLNGRVDAPGDVDIFRLEGQAGQEIVAEVYARRLGSPLDSLLRLLDASGRALAWNDDHPDPSCGLLTHHADSYLRSRLPVTGVYYLRVSDAQHHGGEEYAYRLRLSAPRPDFALRITPSALTLPAGRTTALTVHVLRADGFDGEVELALNGAPAGCVLAGARIPAGRDRVRMTLTVPSDPVPRPLPLRLEGRAHLGGTEILRQAVPAQDLMQAFAYRHLVPAQELLVLVTEPRRFLPYLQPEGRGPLRLPAGGTAQLAVKAVGLPRVLEQTLLELDDPPPGISLEKAIPTTGGWTLVLRADAETVTVGCADNLILKVSAEVVAPQEGGNAAKRRLSLGVLPAIPLEIVPR